MVLLPFSYCTPKAAIWTKTKVSMVVFFPPDWMNSFFFGTLPEGLFRVGFHDRSIGGTFPGGRIHLSLGNSLCVDGWINELVPYFLMGPPVLL